MIIDIEIVSTSNVSLCGSVYLMFMQFMKFDTLDPLDVQIDFGSSLLSSKIEDGHHWQPFWIVILHGGPVVQHIDLITLKKVRWPKYCDRVTILLFTTKFLTSPVCISRCWELYTSTYLWGHDIWGCWNWGIHRVICPSSSSYSNGVTRTCRWWGSTNQYCWS